jgi:hypothetical protein
MPLNKEQLWQVMKAAALLDSGLRDHFLRSLASRLEGVSRPSNRELEGALCATLAQYGIAGWSWRVQRAARAHCQGRTPRAVCSSSRRVILCGTSFDQLN